MTELIVCETCGYNQNPNIPHNGQKLAESLASDIQQHATQITISKTRCLMSCARACNVYLRAENKVGYVIGDLDADGTHNQMLLEYIAHYQQSDNGEVAWKDWPEEIKGKFIARIPL